MDNPEPYWTRPRIAFWAILATIVVVGYGPQFVSAFQPPPGVYRDFAQEWLSARNYWANRPLYRPLHEAMADHTGLAFPPPYNLWNAHPPVSVLIALPFGLFLEYRDALLAWNLASFPLFIIAMAMVLRELRVPFSIWSLLPTLSLTLLAFPVLMNLLQGQLNFILVVLMTLGWVAERRGYPILAGVALGFAAGVKLFPVFLFVYLLFAARWQTLAVSVSVMFGINSVVAGIFGLEAYETYIREVLPSLERFRNSWRNMSVTGFWTRALGSDFKVLAKVLSGVSIIVITTLVAWRSWTSQTIEERDRAFATANVGMLLASPLVWTHYFILLFVPIALMWMRMRSGWYKTLFLMVLSLLWLPEEVFVFLLFGQARTTELAPLLQLPVTPVENLLVMSITNYALVALFAIVTFAPLNKEKPPPLNPYGASPIIPTKPTT